MSVQFSFKYKLEFIINKSYVIYTHLHSKANLHVNNYAILKHMLENVVKLVLQISSHL